MKEVNHLKGVILAGGLGTRLFPLTRVTNKHLLPVYDKPMIFHPIETLVNGGIEDILVVTGGNSAGDFLKLLRNGRDFGLKHLNYAYQEGNGGIAEALGLAETFADGQPIVVMLGDNIIQGNIIEATKKFLQQESGAKILLHPVSDPRRFGCPVIEGDRITRIIEKPADPPTSYAVIGIYFYDFSVFNIIKTLKPSDRGELEITDVNNAYIGQGKMTYDILHGWWTDAGSSKGALHKANTLVAKDGANNLEISLPG